MQQESNCEQHYHCIVLTNIHSCLLVYTCQNKSMISMEQLCNVCDSDSKKKLKKHALIHT